jgi:Domain of unknown function (DUF4194)
MPRNWNALAENSEGVYSTDDFKRAFFQLLTSQCLYLRFTQHVTSYRIISNYRREFEEASELAGLLLRFNDRLEYCYLLPQNVKATLLDKQETVFLLVLRQLYHMHGTVGQLTPEGDAIVSVEELIATYQSIADTPLDNRHQGAIKMQVKLATRRGLARMVDPPDGDPQPFAVAILPAIADILSEHAVGRFGAHLKSALVGHSDTTAAPPDKSEAAE